MPDDSQDANEIAEVLLEKGDDDHVVLSLDNDTELPVSVRRPLYLPSSVDDDVAGGSLRYAVEASNEAVERLDLPGREGIIAAEEVKVDSWNRSRIEFYEVEAGPDDGEDDRLEYGELAVSRDIKAINA